jgi:rhamnose transport system permease protein
MTFESSRVADLLKRYQHESSAAIAFLIMLVIVALIAPSFFSLTNLRDLILSNIPVLLAATGMTLIIIARQIDISIGAQFAVCSVVAGMLAKSGMPIFLVLVATALIGCLIGAINGFFAAKFSIPSIVVTLGSMVALRDSLRWVTEGRWVQNLPPDFQWFGLGQSTGQFLIVLIALSIFLLFGWGLKNLALGRAVYATGSDAEAARLAGIPPPMIIYFIFITMGGLTGIAALLNSIRFSDIQSNAGTGLELKAIAAVVVGGTAIQGGRGTLVGTFIGVALLGTIGTALTFLGINPFWEKALQGAIILAAIASDIVFTRIKFKTA